MLPSAYTVHLTEQTEVYFCGGTTQITSGRYDQVLLSRAEARALRDALMQAYPPQEDPAE